MCEKIYLLITNGQGFTQYLRMQQCFAAFAHAARSRAILAQTKLDTE